MGKATSSSYKIIEGEESSYVIKSKELTKYCNENESIAFEAGLKEGARRERRWWLIAIGGHAVLRELYRRRLQRIATRSKPAKRKGKP